MKKFILLFLAALIVLALAPLPVTAQMQHKPLARELLMYYYVPLIRTEAPIKDKAYAVSQKDTSASVYIGGAGAISFDRCRLERGLQPGILFPEQYAGKIWRTELLHQDPLCLPRIRSGGFIGDVHPEDLLQTVRVR